MAEDEPNQQQSEPSSAAPESAAKTGQPETAGLPEKIAALEAQNAQVRDQLLRKAAEFENYKRRTENDFAALTKYAGENVIVRILPILDDLDRSLKSARESAGNESLIRGIELIQQKFLKALEGLGLKTMECAGKEFDVAYHDALLQVPRSDVAPHTVVEEVEKGYLLFDKVIRHAKVIVSAPADGTAPKEEGGKEKAS